MSNRRFKKAQALFISVLLAGMLPSVAFADTSAQLQKQLDEANAKLDALSEKVAAKGEDLNDTKCQLDVTTTEISRLQKQINQKQQKLDEGKKLVSNRIATNYKTGGVSFLSILLNSNSFEDLVNNVYYLDRANKKDSDLMVSVAKTKSQLESDKSSLETKKTNLEKLKQQKEEQLDQIKAAEAEKQRYVDGLESDLKQKLKEEHDAEIARQKKAAEEAARRAAAAAAASSSSSSSSRFSSSSSSSNGGSSSHGGGSSQGGGSAQATGSRAAVLAAARSQLGVPYVFGAYAPGSALDCSGFTKYCYAAAGISIPHSASAQLASLRRVSVSNLKPGDLIFWIGNANSGSGNHVALYAGNGMIYHANGRAVVYSPLRGGYTAAASGF